MNEDDDVDRGRTTPRAARQDRSAPPDALLPRADGGFAPPGSPTAAAQYSSTTGLPPGSDTVGHSAHRTPEAPPGVFPGTERVDRARVLAGEGYTAARPSNDPFAVAAMVLGVAGLIPLVGLAAIACGHLALHRLRSPERGGRGLAVAGLVLGYTLTVLWALFYLATREVVG